MKMITIGITDCLRYSNYENWIKKEPGVQVIRLSYAPNNLTDIDRCDGILLTGGQDVHPARYNKNEYLKYCHTDIDEKRDDFELQVLEYSQKKMLPVLGICRGLQICNVYFGGTLIPDIPSFGKFDHSKFGEGRDRYHKVSVNMNSNLFNIVGTDQGDTNSAHHQCADVVGKGLIANAFSEDSLIEGLERKDPAGKPWLLLVQWHPERMRDLENKFSKKIKESFLIAAREHSTIELMCDQLEIPLILYILK